MKMLIQTKTLYEELEIIHPHVPAPSSSNCTAMMEELVSLFVLPHWAEIYQEIYTRLHGIQQKCTSADFRQLKNENGFDDKCALCAVLSRVMENYVVYHRKDVAKFVEDEFCTFFDGLVKPTCEAIVHYAGPAIIKGLLNKENTDQICHSSGMCKAECKILGEPAKEARQLEEELTPIINFDLMFGDESKPSPWQWLIDLFTDRFGDKHNPPFDLDNDSFSDISTFRGYHWRGSDCNEFDAKVYPGRKEGKSSRDHDCNGIWGKDAKGADLEEKLCGKSTRLGVAVVGDSAGAHFSIPEKFFNVTMMEKGTFDNLLPSLADEFDLPQESAYTGHTSTSYPTHSVYKYLRRWNLCNNNDYQNLGVNGGDSGNTWGNIKALQRSQGTDHPMILFLELVGNDVCGSSVGGTAPAEFKKNIIRLLDWLDTKLPKGSHVFILGLADGDLLFKFLHGTIHPLNVTYDKVYDFLNCLKISPCSGWLSTNATARKYTTELAKNLSKIYQQILDEGQGYKNYDAVYYDFPTE
jgi:acyloxyacyl hydrolase